MIHDARSDNPGGNTAGVACKEQRPVNCDMSRGTGRRKARLCIAIALVFTGCGTASLPVRYPSVPPASMSPATAEQDQRDCLTTARQATAERAWAYIGCMVSRGHSVGVAFHVQSQVTHLQVTQSQPHGAPEVSRDLESCRRSAYGAGRAQGGTRAAIIDRMETTFRACLLPLGYGVARTPGA
jgi:hypothetical protein